MSDSSTAGESEEDHYLKTLARSKSAKRSENDDWSTNEDGQQAYRDFKNRKSLKRKRLKASSSRKGAVGRRKEAYTQTDSDEGHDTTRNHAATADDDGDELPIYLKDRRSQFEKRRSILKEAGLKLPPRYDDIEFSDDEHLAILHEKPDFPNATPCAPYEDKQLPYSLGLIPAPIAQWLRDYQVEGVSFLHRVFVYQTGGILGDDMGLGKTIQVIAFLTAAFGKTGDERDAKRMRKMRRAGNDWYPRVLVVCPGTLIENWKAEFNRWGWWHVDIYHGADKEAALQAATTGRLEILITTYTTYRMNKSAINCVDWDCVIADECHHIKGRDSETTRAMNELNALCRIGLTGTAIQNTYDELHTLLNWVSPGTFGPISEWKKSISEPLRIGQSHDATIYELGKARKTAKALVENLLPRFFLRRMKSLIAHQLPKKRDRVIFCPLTSTQADAYQRFVESDVVQYIRNSTDTCHCGSGKKAGWCHYEFLPDGIRWQSYVFPAMVTLQKLANHVAILIPQGTDPKEKQEKDLAMLKATLPDQWRDLYRSRDSILNYSNIEFCGKWKVLKKLLKFWHDNGDKVLVFSHSVRLLKMLRMLFQNTAYNVSYLDGSMSYEDRAKEVHDYNNDLDQFVFLISTKAGGVGLNITSANKVVIMDPNWNPAWDLQAQDRAYRIGQVRDVEVFRLVSVGTIEEIVYARQIYKQQQANIGYTASKERRYFTGVQNNTAQKGEIFGLRNMFAYHGDQVVLQQIVNKTNVAESRVGVSIIDLDLEGQSTLGEEDVEDESLPGRIKDENSAMSQLAALIAAGGEESSTNTAPSGVNAGKTTKPKGFVSGSKKSDPVQAILAGAGVSYSHENSEVIGSSRIEAHLSRKAEEQRNDIDVAEQRLFPETFDQLNERPDTSTSTNYQDDQQPEWLYKPPADVCRRQFCSIAKSLGFEDVSAFALVVEGWTQAQRRACLEKFYRGRRAALGLSLRPSPDGAGAGAGLSVGMEVDDVKPSV